MEELKNLKLEVVVMLDKKKILYETTHNKKFTINVSEPFNSKVVNSWTKVCSIADMAKYAKQIPNLDQFNKDKTNYIDLIKSFHKIKDFPNKSTLT